MFRCIHRTPYHILNERDFNLSCTCLHLLCTCQHSALSEWPADIAVVPHAPSLNDENLKMKYSAVDYVRLKQYLVPVGDGHTER
jgi:hypothetical protein